MAGIQCKLANNVDAHRYESSTSNQRIENFWLHKTKLYLSWIINFFRDLVNTRSLIWGNVFRMEFLWFVCSPLIQYELDRVKEHGITKLENLITPMYMEFQMICTYSLKVVAMCNTEKKLTQK